MIVDRAEAARSIDAFLRAIGRDPDVEPALRGTGRRVADAFVDDLCAGYAVDPEALLRGERIAAEGAEANEPRVVVRGIAVATTCPHHLLPAIGRADVAFAPRAFLVGIGALADAVDALSRRLSLQEDVARGAAAAIARALEPSWCAVRVTLSHACMTTRGGRRHGATVETFAFEGDAAGRAEALAIFGGARGSRA